MTQSVAGSPINRRYFWDVDPATLDPETYSTFIIERLLEEGDKVAVAWLEQTYDRQNLRDVVRSSRRLSPKTANFFALRLGIPKGEIRCLTPSYQKAHVQRWPH